ncbi:uncharacterized protein LOC122258673 [Penaeus japonicus]|uniref:uncharacterized protein LOC122258673 n=1 Tax=Penaeus japonicus TaxID=27405 RepID=UPI001C70EF0A|nr:uncharacterized protein LOC122258673 [Penaeus japonicus]
MSNKGVEWSFNRSSDAPWLNGSCESLIKSVKMSIQKAIGESILTYAEFHTVLFEIANLINSRPIGMKPGYTIELGSYLCPNDLLLGRSNREAPFGKFDLESTLNKRLHFTQNIVFSFWKRWQRDYFPMLIVRKRWHSKFRNIQIGDIVLIQDSNAIRGTWKIGFMDPLYSRLNINKDNAFNCYLILLVQ